MATKEYISANQLLEDSFMLARKIYDDPQFKPTALIALWRGGTPIGIAIEEFFKVKNAPIANHNSIRVSAYNHDTLKNEVTIFNLDYIAKTLSANDHLLIVDDVVDTGASIKKFIETLRTLCGDNTPQKIKVATVYYKPKTASFTPDYYLHRTDAWLVFPHELEGLSPKEIELSKGTVISQALDKQ